MTASRGRQQYRFSLQEHEALSELVRTVLHGSDGKLTRTDKYVHKSVADQDPMRELSISLLDGLWNSFVPGLGEWNILKVSKTDPCLSLLWYPEFESCGHPELRLSLKIDFGSGSVRLTDYRNSKNRPILHRKEMLVTSGYPLRLEFARLTEQELGLGLLDQAYKVGFSRQWNERLESIGAQIHDHRIVCTTHSTPGVKNA